jgi:hypothetical protein
VPLLAALGACDDKGAVVYVSNQSLAVGSYTSIDFTDACGGGALSPCITDGVTAVLESRTGDPNIADIVLGQDHPRAPAALNAYYLLAKKPGQTSVYFKGTFTDGSTRQASTTVTIKAPDVLAVDVTCQGNGMPSTNLLASLGGKSGFRLDLLAGTEKLDGFLPDAVTADGVTEEFNDENDNLYAWQVPATAGVTQLASPHGIPIDGLLTAYGPAQVTGMIFNSRNPDSPAAYFQPGPFYVNTQVVVQGQTPCDSLIAELRTATPDICSGPSGETVWPADDTTGGAATVHAEGACTLSVGLPGDSRTLNTATFPIFFVQPPPTGLQTPGYQEPCPVEGGTSCDFGYGGIGLCKGGVWTEMTQCPFNQTCDFVPDTTPGCVAGASCARCRGLP